MNIYRTAFFINKLANELANKLASKRRLVSLGVNNSTAIACGVILSALLLSHNAYARKSDFTQPIDVSADRSEYDERAGVQTLIGNVEIKQGTMTIKADKIAIKLTNNQLSRIEGSGSPIEFQQENEAGELVTGTANAIDYDALNGSLILTGNATLSQPRQRLQSERIVFNSTEQKVSAEGGDKGRVSIRIQPPASK